MEDFDALEEKYIESGKIEDLRKILKHQLQDYNKLIADILEDRKNFVENHKEFFAEFAIGQKVINTKTLEYGIVTRHYQFSYVPDEYDRFNIHCEIHRCDKNWNDRKVFDNTSCYGSTHPFVDFDTYTKEFCAELHSK